MRDEYFYLNQKFKKILYSNSSKEKRKKITRRCFGILMLLGFGFSFGYSFLQPAKLTASTNESTTITTINKNTENILTNETLPTTIKEETPPLLKDEKNRTNFLLIGVPGEPWPAPYLSDSIEVVSISQDKKDVFVVALPRDLLVKIPGSKYETRINALYAMEQSPTLLQEKVQEITGLQTQYWVVIDLQLIEKVVDAVDGVDVEVKKDIYDPRFPTVDRRYETFSISAGPQHLDGKTAIKYIRSRHQDQGDFSRIERQQQIMDALRLKALDPKYLPKLLTLFSEFQNKTNISIGEIKTLINLAQNLSQINSSSTNNDSANKIKYFLLDAGNENSLLVYGKTILDGTSASVLWPKAGKFNYSKIKEKIKELETL